MKIRLVCSIFFDKITSFSFIGSYPCTLKVQCSNHSLHIVYQKIVSIICSFTHICHWLPSNFRGENFSSGWFGWVLKIYTCQALVQSQKNMGRTILSAQALLQCWFLWLSNPVRSGKEHRSLSMTTCNYSFHLHIPKYFFFSLHFFLLAGE